MIKNYADFLEELNKPHSQCWQVRIEKWQPTTINVLLSAHYFVAARYKKMDREIIAHYFKDIPKAQKKRTVNVTIELGYKQRGADVDAYHKSLLDSLVHAGMLIDDSKEWVEIYPVEYIRGKMKATTIKICEAI